MAKESVIFVGVISKTKADEIKINAVSAKSKAAFTVATASGAGGASPAVCAQAALLIRLASNSNKGIEKRFIHTLLSVVID